MKTPYTKQIQTISLIFYFLLGGMTLMMIVMSLIQGEKTDSDVFIYIIPAIFVVSIVFGHFIFTTLLKNIKQKDDLSKKLQGYLSASIVRFALIEGASFLCSIAYFLEHNFWFLVLNIILILYFIYLNPTRQRITTELDLSRDEALELQKI